VLARLLGEVVAETRPRSLLVLGASNGNGLEHVDPAIRVTAVDLNSGYLASLAARFPAVEVVHADLATYAFEPGAWDLVHAALVLEYVDWRALLARIGPALAQGGRLSVVVQLPSADVPAVTPTAFTSLAKLDAAFGFVDPDDLVAAAAHAGWAVERRAVHAVGSGKELLALRFVR
jgi:trans-aconitate methyltransferase